MLSKAAVGRILGVTREHARVLVLNGCPQTSEEDVLAWRENNPPRRAATNGNSRDQKAKKVAPTQRQKSDRAKKGSTEKPPEKPKLKQPVIPPKTGDSLQDALNNAVHVADRAYEEYLFASENRLSTMPLRLSEHSKALDARLKAEKAFREEQERRGNLVNKSQILEVSRKGIEAMLRRLKRLAQEAGPQCNPENPLLATRILDREVRSIIAAGKKEVDGLR